MLLQPVDFFLSKKATSLLCQDAHGANKKYEIAAKASGMFLGGLSGSGSVRVRVTPNWMAKSHSKQIHVFLTLFSPRNPQKKWSYNIIHPHTHTQPPPLFREGARSLNVIHPTRHERMMCNSTYYSIMAKCLHVLERRVPARPPPF